MTGALLLGAAILLIAGSGAAFEPGRQLVTADEVRRAGISRLGDVVLLADGWDVTTIDRFEWRVSPRGLSSFDRPAWQVFVDGRRVDLDHLGSRNLNRLPIALDAVASVEFFDAPGMIEGQVVEAGAIHIRTKRSDEGASLGLRLATGSETGDPGPFFYTSENRRDVERDGHEASGTLSWADDAVWVRGSLRSGEHLAGDLAILERLRGIADGRPWVYGLRAASAGAGWESDGGRLEVDGGLAQTDHAWFARPVGRELALDDQHAEARVRGAHRVGPVEVTAGASWFRNRAATVDRATGPELDWERRTLLVNGAAILRGTAGRVRVGGEIERVRATDASLGFTIARARADLGSRPSADAAGATLGLELSRSGDDTGGKVLLDRRWVAGATSIDVTLQWSERLPVEDGRVWMWRERGVDPLEGAGLDVTVDGVMGATLSQSIDFGVTHRFGGLSVSVAPLLRVLSGVVVDLQSFGEAPDAPSFESPTAVKTNAQGAVAGVEARVARHGRHVTWRASWRYQSVFDADDAFARLWAPVPEHRARLTVDVDPTSTLSVRAAARAIGRREFPAFERSPVVDPAFLVDLSLRQRLLRDRFAVGLTLMNLFDDDAREHPVGAESGLRFLVQAEMMLGGAR